MRPRGNSVFCGFSKKIDFPISEDRRAVSAENLSRLPLNQLLHEEIAEEDSSVASSNSSLQQMTRV